MQGAKTSSLSVRLAAHPASVPAARRFVVDGLTASGFAHLCDVSELIVSELAGNAALHGAAQFLDVTISTRDDGVRLGVEDDGPVDVRAVSPQAVPVEQGAADWPDSASTTGRGLAIVSMLSDDWGVDVTPQGKRVWADITDPDAVHAVRSPRTAETGPVALSEAQLPPGWVLVVLRDCPVALSLQQDQHLDELVRELQLMAASNGNAQSRVIAQEIQDILISPTSARLTGRRMAERALAEGRPSVDVEMAMPMEFSPLMRRLHDAVTRADELCDQNQLLSLTSPPDIRRLREWMAEEIIAQTERRRPARSWGEWVATRHPTRAAGASSGDVEAPPPE